MVTARTPGFAAHYLGMSPEPQPSPRHRAEPRDARHRGKDEPLTVAVRVIGALVVRAAGRALLRVLGREALRQAAREAWPHVRDVGADVLRWLVELVDLVGQWLA